MKPKPSRTCEIAKEIKGKNRLKPPLFTLLFGILGGVLLLVAGCSPKAPQLGADDLKAFDGAPAEVKQMWEKALAADKANDYVTAQSLLDSLDKMILSDSQRKALNTENNAFQLRLIKAVDKNDPAAIKAVQEINQSRSRRK